MKIVSQRRERMPYVVNIAVTALILIMAVGCTYYYLDVLRSQSGLNDGQKMVAWLMYSTFPVMVLLCFLSILYNSVYLAKQHEKRPLTLLESEEEEDLLPKPSAISVDSDITNYNGSGSMV
jgi:TRAP-type C4-dicarboxylate transport system permease small subunit